MTTPQLPYGLGHVITTDERDKNFLLSSILPPEEPFITEKTWWEDGWWGDQGQTSECTAYSWSHWLEDNPMQQTEIPNCPKPLYKPDQLYRKFQANDGIPGPHEGSTIRAGAKVLKETGLISQYLWASNIGDIIKCLLTLGPMVVGTLWYTNMFKPNAQGLVTPTGNIAGGHAYLLNGVDTVKRLIRIKNSWGRSYGINGNVYISFDDFEKLFIQGGQGCMALAQKITSLPSLDSIANSVDAP